MLGYIDGTKNTEKGLHKRFEKFRIRNNGEWFCANQELIDYINNVNQIPNIYVVKNELCENKVMACKTI